MHSWPSATHQPRPLRRPNSPCCVRRRLNSLWSSTTPTAWGTTTGLRSSRRRLGAGSFTRWLTAAPWASSSSGQFPREFWRSSLTFSYSFFFQIITGIRQKTKYTNHVYKYFYISRHLDFLPLQRDCKCRSSSHHDRRRRVPEDARRHYRHQVEEGHQHRSRTVPRHERCAWLFLMLRHFL